MNKETLLLAVSVAEFVVILMLLFYIRRRFSERKVGSEEEKVSSENSNKNSYLRDKILLFWAGLFQRQPVIQEFSELTMKDIVSIVQRLPVYKNVQDASKRLHFVSVPVEKIPVDFMFSPKLKNHDSVGLFVVSDLNGTPEQVCHIILWEKMSDELENFLKEGNGALELCV